MVQEAFKLQTSKIRANSVKKTGQNRALKCTFRAPCKIRGEWSNSLGVNTVSDTHVKITRTPLSCNVWCIRTYRTRPLATPGGRVCKNLPGIYLKKDFHKIPNTLPAHVASEKRAKCSQFELYIKTLSRAPLHRQDRLLENEIATNLSHLHDKNFLNFCKILTKLRQLAVSEHN